VLFFRDGILGAELLCGLELGGRTLIRRTGAIQLGTKTIHFGLERPRVDLEEWIAASNDGAFLEPYGGNQTGDARTDFDRIDRLQPSGEFIPFGHIAFDDAGHGDLWRRGRTRLCRCLHAAGRENENGEWR